jgi:hypothetical protein
VTRPRIRNRRDASPGTIRARLVAGLEALGYERRAAATRRFFVYRRPDGTKNWYVGASGALRIGETVGGSRAAGAITKTYVLTAPAVRPAVFAWLEAHPTPNGVDPAALARDVARSDPALAELPLRIVLAHVNAWLAQRTEVAP